MPAGNLKGALVDKYAQIALYDAAENQRVILEAQQAEVRKKAEMKAALDLQIRLQHEAAVREKEEDREWVQREQERIAIWNKEEEVKIEATKAKEMNIRKQREQQLRGACTACLLKLSAYCELFVTELAALRERERSEMAEYEIDILRGIHKEIKQVLLTPPTTCNHSTPHHLTSLPRRSARERWRNALPTRRTFARWLSRT